MKIAIAQLNYTVGDIDGNTAKIVGAIDEAKARRADLVIFAEQAVSGTPAFDLLRKTTFLELCEEALEKIASRCDGITALVGLPVLTREGTISAAALLENGRIQRYIGKKYISARREMGFLVPSKGYEYITVKGHKCAVVVGDDLSRERDFDKSVETIISINARRYGKGTMTYRYEMMRDLAFVEGKNLVMANQVGGSTEIVYDGTSGAMNSRGEVVVMMKSFEEDFQIFDTKAEAAPIAVSSSYNERTRLIYEAARCGVRDFFRKNGYEKASIGLSGGIDSAVVASIAVDALGAENVRALLMPSPFSSDESVEDAKRLAANLGIGYNVIPISEIYTSVVNTLKPVIGGTEFDSTEENIQTRIHPVRRHGRRFQPHGRPLQKRNVRRGALYQPHDGQSDSRKHPDQGAFVGAAPRAEGQRHPASLRGGGRHSVPHDRGGAAPRGDRQCGFRRRSGGEDPFDDHAQREETLPVPARAASFLLLVRPRTADAPDEQIRRLRPWCARSNIAGWWNARRPMRCT